MNQQQENEGFKAEHAIEVNDGDVMDYTKDYIYGSDQSQYVEQEEAGSETEG